MLVPMTDRIQNTLSQGCTSLQSLVQGLEHRGIASDTVCSQARLYRLHNAWKCIFGAYIYSYMTQCMHGEFNR